MNALYNLPLILTLFVTLGKSLHVKILVVEDEVELSKSICLYLKEEGYVCEVATDYSTALQKTETYTYDEALDEGPAAANALHRCSLIPAIDTTRCCNHRCD